MTADTAQLAYRTFDKQETLATFGEPVYGEATSNGWRQWSTHRSKLASMIDRGFEIELTGDTRVLYLGAASGTTVSHLADIVDVVYAIEFAPRPMSNLLDVAETRPNIIPLLKDARRPASYAHIVESDIDLLVQDVATRDQARVAISNSRFLHPDGKLALAIKARSVDVTASPTDTFDATVSDLSEEYEITNRVSLEPEHGDHLAILGRKRPEPA